MAGALKEIYRELRLQNHDKAEGNEAERRAWQDTFRALLHIQK
jgi:hypothetical protein